MAGIKATKGTRTIETVVQERTVIVELSVKDAERVFNFIEFATRTDADWRGYASKTNSGLGTTLSTAGGREQTEDLARAIGLVTDQYMGTTQHAK